MALTTFGAKLRKWRDENELTRRELSEMIYFSENAIVDGRQAVRRRHMTP